MLQRRATWAADTLAVYRTGRLERDQNDHRSRKVFVRYLLPARRGFRGNYIGRASLSDVCLSDKDVISLVRPRMTEPGTTKELTRAPILTPSAWAEMVVRALQVARVC